MKKCEKMVGVSYCRPNGIKSWWTAGARQ
jgi:hypothetical protein